MKQKTGRKQKHHIDTATGLPVAGLTRRPDGRWRVIGTHQTFREPDEQKAISRFRELMGKKRVATFERHGSFEQRRSVAEVYVRE